MKFITFYFSPFCNSGFAKVLAELCFSTRSPSQSRLWKYGCGLLDFGSIVVVLLGLVFFDFGGIPF